MRNRNNSAHRLLVSSMTIVLAHFLLVIWHLVLLSRVQPAFPRAAYIALVAVNLVPFGGVAALARGFNKVAAAMIAIPFGVALVAGTYTHFLSAGLDNVLRMPPSPERLAFQISAVLLVTLEAAGCLVAFRMSSAGKWQPNL